MPNGFEHMRNVLELFSKCSQHVQHILNTNNRNTLKRGFSKQPQYGLQQRSALPKMSA